MERLLENKTVLVTAGTSGIGRGICTVFARHGAAVAVHYRSDKAAAEALAGGFRLAGGRACAVHADLRDAAQVRAAVAEAEAALGPLDVLVNNASIFLPPKPIESVPWAEMQAEFEGSMQTSFHATQAVLPGMLSRGAGRILFLVGTLPTRPATGFAAHTTGKGALLAFAQCLAKETGPRGIAVHCIHPGMTLTPGVLADVPEAEREALRRKTPNRHLPGPEELAGLAVFLASDLSSSATALQLNGDGGLAALGG